MISEGITFLGRTFNSMKPFTMITELGRLKFFFKKKPFHSVRKKVLTGSPLGPGKPSRPDSP